MSPTVVGLVRAQFRNILNGGLWEVHADFTTDQPIDVPFLETTGAGLANWFASTILDSLSSENAFVEVFMQSLDPDQPAEVSVTDGLPLYGGVSGAAGANQSAIVASLVSSDTSPSGKGRMFISGYHNSDYVHGLLSAALVAAIDAALSALATMAGSTALQWVIYSVKEDVANAVAGWVVRSIPGGVNKRRIGRGF